MICTCCVDDIQCVYARALPRPAAETFIEVTGEILEFDTLSPGHNHRKMRFPNEFYPDVSPHLCPARNVRWCFNFTICKSYPILRADSKEPVFCM